MDTNTTMRVFDSLTKGRGTAKEAAIRTIDSTDKSLDRILLRQLISHALKESFFPPKNGQPENIKYQDTRCWLLSALGRLSMGDRASLEFIKEHLNPQKEPYVWARYWALEGLVAANDANLTDVAKAATKDPEPIVVSFATAIMAGKGDDAAFDYIRTNLKGNDDMLRRAVLRALRFAPLNDTEIIEYLSKTIKDGIYSDHTYDSIIILGKTPPDSQLAEKAAQTLMEYLINFRWPMHEAMRIKALNGLGNLGFEWTASVLVEELSDDSPAIVSHAARALQKVLGVPTATKRIFDAAAKSNAEFTTKYANALRYMERETVVSELEMVMLSGTEGQQELARTLLSEVGGAQAFQRLSARARAVNQYMNVLESAEAKVRDLFEKSLLEAKQGFRVATIMDIVVFAIGVVLIGISAGLCLAKQGNLDNWTGVTLTGGVGVLGVLYGILISKPRRQIRESVDHLMYLKVVFLAYLRQLHQADQAYTRRLLDDKVMTATEVSEFSKMVAATMSEAVVHLTKQSPQVGVITNVTLAENGQRKPADLPEQVN